MNVRPAFLAWLMLATIAFFATGAHAQSADSCETFDGGTTWYKWAINKDAAGATSPRSYVYASKTIACGAAESNYCSANPTATNCTGGRRPWTAQTSTLTNTNCKTALGGTPPAFLQNLITGQEVTTPVVNCPADPPPGCDPIEGQAGTKFTAGDWRDIASTPNDFCHEATSCKIKMRQATQIGGASVWTMEYTAEDCTPGAEEGPEDIDHVDGESCTPVGDGEYCASPSGEGNCGYLNDKFVCLDSVPDKGCKYMSDGAGVCDAEAGTPPKPDSGTPGTPATADDEIETETRDSAGNPPSGGGGCGAGCDYYDPDTVAASERDPTDTGGSGGGGDNVGGVGEPDPDEEESEELTPPELGQPDCEIGECAGAFYNRVAAAPIVASISGVGASIPGGTCPSYTLEMFGEEYSLSEPMCEIWDTLSAILSALFLAIYAWVATRIVLSA